MGNPSPSSGKRRLARLAKIVIGLLVVAVIGAAIWIPRMNRFQVDGQIVLAGPQAQVTIVRDEKGMPYIHADSMRDATFAQGFAAAQDRLFHMQLMRLQAQGRLTELVGQDASELDIRNRTIGMARVARKHAEILDDDTRSMFQSYVDGINAFLDHCPGDVPVEFGLAGIEPDRWAIEDSLSVMYLMAWDTSANLNHELVWQMLVDRVGADRAADLVPININADDSIGDEQVQADTAPSSANHSASRFAPIPANLHFQTDTKLQALLETGPLRVGSNNWAAGPQVSAGDHAMLAGDPHLDPRMLPGIMYAVGFVWPDGRAVGAGVPGIPGFIVGRNEHVATAVTNSYGDVQDLYVETLDPEKDGHYLQGGQSIPFKTEKETLKIKDGAAAGGFREQEFEIRFTSRGPVVSDVLAGLEGEKVTTLRWAAVESMEPHIGLMELLNAKSIDDVHLAIKSVTAIVLNFVFADSEGNIGWRVSGRVPIRTPESGTMPHEVDSENEWQDNWQGWIPFDEMPHRQNPSRGWLGTANHYTVAADYRYYFTNYASPSYRYRRLKQRMEESDGELTVDDHWSIQRDTKNLMAEAVTPILVEALAADEQTASLAGVLREWDFHDDIDQPGPTVFQTVYTEFAKLVFQDELGEELAARMLGNWYFWQERFENMVRSGDSPWFDDTSTDDVTETMPDMIQRAGKSAVARLQPQLGSDPSQWQWGKVHTMQWVNPIRRSGVGMNWLGTAPIPANGSTETLYRGWYDFDDPYGVTHTAAVRMVVDFGDSEKVRAVMAGGETARTFHPHQKDQIDAYMSGAALHWWFSDKAIEEHAQSRLTLVPQS